MKVVRADREYLQQTTLINSAYYSWHNNNNNWHNNNNNWLKVRFVRQKGPCRPGTNNNVALEPRQEKNAIHSAGNCASAV